MKFCSTCTHNGLTLAELWADSGLELSIHPHDAGNYRSVLIAKGSVIASEESLVMATDGPKAISELLVGDHIVTSSGVAVVLRVDQSPLPGRVVGISSHHPMFIGMILFLPEGFGPPNQ